MAEIRPISHKVSLAVKDLKIAVAVGKVYFPDKILTLYLCAVKNRLGEYSTQRL
jgi:hypothetical protein